MWGQLVHFALDGFVEIGIKKGTFEVNSFMSICCPLDLSGFTQPYRKTCWNIVTIRSEVERNWLRVHGYFGNAWYSVLYT
jgi:hypothetical protein